MIKPEKDSQWYRYDDERVIPVPLSQVLEENFGGGGEDILTTKSKPLSNNGIPMALSRLSRAQMKRFTSAYMLVYLREDVIDKLLAPITSEDIPAHVIKMVEKESAEMAKRKKEQEEMHLFMNVRVVDSDSFRRYEGLDMANFDPYDKNAVALIHSYRVKRDMSWMALYNHLAEENHLPRDHIRLWNFVNRQNKTIRPDAPILPDSPGSNPPAPKDSRLMTAVEAWLRGTRVVDLRVYMERASDIWHPTVPILPPRRSVTNPNPPPPYLEALSVSPPPPQPHNNNGYSVPSSVSPSDAKSNNIVESDSTNGVPVEWPDVGKTAGVYGSRHDPTMVLLFLKWFDIEGQRLRGERPIYVNRNHKTSAMIPFIAEMMGWQGGEPGEPPVQISLFEEIKPGMTETIKAHQTNVVNELADGDIVVFMKCLTPKRYLL
jgi:hypothetical protein